VIFTVSVFQDQRPVQTAKLAVVAAQRGDLHGVGEGGLKAGGKDHCGQGGQSSEGHGGISSGGRKRAKQPP